MPIGDHPPVLGSPPEIGAEALKVHYRKLITENHPDKMIARGVPPEFVSMATKKIAAHRAVSKIRERAGLTKEAGKVGCAESAERSR